MYKETSEYLICKAMVAGAIVNRILIKAKSDSLKTK